MQVTSSFARSATSPSFAYVSNPVPDSSLCRAAAPRLQSCCSPRDCVDPFQLLLSSRLASASAAALNCVRPTASRLRPTSVSTASRLRPLRLLLENQGSRNHQRHHRIYKWDDSDLHLPGFGSGQQPMKQPLRLLGRCYGAFWRSLYPLK